MYVRVSNVAGRGLFAAREYAAGEYLNVYRGVDLGEEHSPEGVAARAMLEIK